MGLSFFSRNCHTNRERDTQGVPVAPAPNPSPSRWTYLDHKQFDHAYVLKVRYHDCTNFEGVKVMVYRGQFRKVSYLDPHFTNSPESPIARFRPDKPGWWMALELARALT